MDNYIKFVKKENFTVYISLNISYECLKMEMEIVTARFRILLQEVICVQLVSDIIQNIMLLS